MNETKPSAGRRILSVVLKAGAAVLALALVVFAAFWGLLFVTLRGPSPTMRDIVTMSLNETSAIYWFPRLVLSQEEVDEILAAKKVEQDDYTNASLIHIDAGVLSSAGADGEPAERSSPTDGITVEEVHGASYVGYMMLVEDPSRLVLGTPDRYGADVSGLTLYEMVEKYGAVAGINAGGFYDPDGYGNGGIPDGLVIADGEIKYGDAGTRYNFVGIDEDYVLFTGVMSAGEAVSRGMRYACSFGPALVVNGEPQNIGGTLSSGINPRTALGQREDGTLLLLVVDGRQSHSMGASFDDLVDIMISYGAVNASNLDGGSSTLMLLEGEPVNSCASVIGPRPMPTSWLILP